MSRGILAGIATALLAMFMEFVTLIIAVVMRKTLLFKVFHISVASDDDIHGGTTLLADAVVAGTASLFAASIATWAVLSMLKQGHRATFFTTSGLGFTVIATRWWHAGPQHVGALLLDVIVGLFMAFAGLFLTEMALRQPVKKNGGGI